LHPMIILFCSPGAPPAFQAEMERTLMRHLRSQDYVTQMDFEMPHLAVLLPVTAKDGASALIQRIRSAWFRTDYRLESHPLDLVEPGDMDRLVAKAGLNGGAPPDPEEKQEEAKPPQSQGAVR